MVYPDCTESILAETAACDTEASPSKRAAAVVKALNITEKLKLLVDATPGAPRIGLPPYEWWSEGLHGVGGSAGVFWTQNGSYSYATSFAMPILLSAAFDDDLVEKVAEQISTEARAFSNGGHGGLDFWTPNINPYKDPRWGRGSETPGEDPFRIKGYVKSFVRGLEGNDEKIRKVIATCKHLAAYDLEAWGDVDRYNFSAIVGLQDLSEYYLPPFQECARSNVGSIMCSYNSVNGTPACANSYLMNDILREHWGWTQDNNYITSDCGAIENIWANHFYASDKPHAAAIAYERGTDTVCELGYVTNVTGAYDEGLLSEQTIDKALARLFEGLVRVGYFDPATASSYRDINFSEVSTPSALVLALQSAQGSMVLKKNDGILPLNLQNRSVAVIGMWANAPASMLGGYSGYPLWYHNPLYAAEQLGIKVYYADGPIAPNSSTSDNWTTSAVAAARKADVVVYCGGIDNSVEAEELDRYSIAWPDAQLALIEKLGALNKPLVVAQLGDQLDDTPLLDNNKISAILWGGFPGQDGGTALFNIITGKSAPAGRLPVTQYPASYVDSVPMTDTTLRPSSNNPGRTYRWYDKAVLPFGYGLHYTKFVASFQDNDALGSYDIAELIKTCNTTNVAYPDLCEFSSVDIKITNAGNTTSDFVALAFLTGEYGPRPYPLKTLAAYTRLRDIKPGQGAEASLKLTLGSLSRVDESGNMVLYPGDYELLLDVPTQSTIKFTLSGDAVVLDEFPQPRV
ncbi:glycoside hydrolase family 3 protein [Hypoxylon trugodes]|uniref:glycoside hydrolase family 3 protein n=1 Tax=Hypoxylon trugodes TaxID=326681 RepID=UPI00219B072B|nr:glycoside hydrolase family 3 protein [Hypoxylon trugodes]KAI1390476.1 glycoside hydrolase family 3 protein [Hypoxylon trugodes]